MSSKSKSGKSASLDESTSTAATAEEEAAGVPTQHRSAFMSFLQQLASFSGDLSQLTAPTFLLNGISLLEYSTHWADHPKYLADISKKDDPLGMFQIMQKNRMVAVTKWFLSTLYGSYHERCKDGSEKKPYNPILGEQFFCRWEEDASSSSGSKGGWKECMATIEQVSHHPPVSAFHINIPSHDISVTGHCGQKSKFKGMTIKVEQTGRAQLDLPKRQEVVKISLPELVIRGILSGNIFLELSGSCHLISSSGYRTVIEFLPKPWFSGGYHQIKGIICKEGQETQPLYRISGNWTTKCYIQNCGNDKEELFFDVETIRPKKLIAPLSAQKDNESRKVWEKVTKALDDGNYGLAAKEKTEIEETQRALRKERKENKETWKPMFFEFIPDSASADEGDGKGSTHDQIANSVNLLRRSSSFEEIKTLDVGSYKFKGGF